MQCPVCNIALMMSDRNGIEIDYCPQCRGVWLDRGELDKIVERSNTGPVQQAPQFQQPQRVQQSQSHYRHDDDDDDDDHYRHQDSNHGHHKKHKKENFLGELFDF